MEITAQEDGWQELECLQEQIRIVLPQGWERPEDKILERKFPYDMPPQEVFTDTQADRIITLNILDKQLQDKQVYSAISEIQRAIVHVYPESIKEQARRLKTESGAAGYFSFITGGIKEDTCHYMFILPAEKRMLLGSLHLPAGEAREGKKMLLEVIKNIQVREEKKDNERLPNKNRAI